MAENQTKFRSQADVVLEFEKEFDRQDSEADFFPTGVAAHDQTLGRLRRGMLILVAGRSSMGKTSLMLLWALNMLAMGIKVFWFCLEIQGRGMISRIISSRTGIPLLDIVERRLSEDHIKAIIGTMPAIRDLPGNWTEESNLGHIQRLISEIPKRSRSIVFLDHLHLVDVSGVRLGDRYSAVGQVLLTMKRLAVSVDIPIVVACQLNRQVEHRKDKLPVMSDLKDNSDLEHGAQLIMGLYRPGFNDKSIPDDELQIVCMKNTEGPRINYIMEWNGPCAMPREKTKRTLERESRLP